MVDVCGSTSSVHYSITARPNCSLSPAGTLCAFFIITFVTLTIASGFTLLGAWPVLPFAGIELLILWLCFRHIWRHVHDYERLTIDDHKVIVEKHDPKCDSHIELNGYWAQVVMEYMPDGECRRLALRSHGKEIEFGRLLNSEERLNLGRQLQSRLGHSQT
ncbi:MAG: DUF2244 domain-containing protein [Methylocystis sp.]|uniref:DUF2244 domain-containing protein n=1 Tax=Methylocystis sp. TaxID=1911079 RepID=UPI003DA53033